MSDDFDGPEFPFDDDSFLDADLDANLASLLGDPAVWEEPAPELEDSVVAAVQREMLASADPTQPSAPIELPTIGIPADRHEAIVNGGGQPASTGQRHDHDAGTDAGSDTGQVISIDRARRRWTGPVLAAAAAAIIAVAAFGLGSGFFAQADRPDLEVALAGTDLAPEASAVAEVSNTPQGTRIILDVTDLPPAGPNQYYEAWLRQSPEVGVSAGTFHLRGGDASIELWSGVTIDDYPLITVTLQDEGAGAASSGVVVLKGTVGG